MITGYFLQFIRGPPTPGATLFTIKNKEQKMLVIKVEHWPFGREDKKKEMGRMTLSNDATGSRHTGNYKVEILKSSAMGASATGVWKSGRVCGYPRQSRAVGVWDLIRSGLNNTLKNRPVWGGK